MVCWAELHSSNTASDGPSLVRSALLVTVWLKQMHEVTGLSPNRTTTKSQL